jgi:hypothetical protein
MQWKCRGILCPVTFGDIRRRKKPEPNWLRFRVFGDPRFYAIASAAGSVVAGAAFFSMTFFFGAAAM